MIGNNIPSLEDQQETASKVKPFVPPLKKIPPKGISGRNSHRNGKYSPINASISLNQVSPRGYAETIKTIDEYDEGLSAFDDSASKKNDKSKKNQDQMLFVDLGSPLGGLSNDQMTPEKLAL